MNDEAERAPEQIVLAATAIEHAKVNRTDLQRVVHFFESMTPESLGQIDRIYAPDAYFKDPFNEVHGSAAIARIFEHMYRQVDAPRFVITGRFWQGQESDDGNHQGRSAFLTWDFLFRMKRFSATDQQIRGASHLRFDEQGRINFHRDYWDAAEELYEKLPLIGGLMRMFKGLARR